MDAFESKFKSKAGVAYSQRKTYAAKPKKYEYKTVNYSRAEVGTPMWQYWVDDFVDGKRPGGPAPPSSRARSRAPRTPPTTAAPAHRSRCSKKQPEIA